ncbi:TIGR03364 family FAD-dependent oxidoreductase [Pseudarthrobacter sp. J75]|uniref:TIGR03364 family FAD-dependent oxidoreductase n=1 Tax=unclassified Pseudarthrobacter TaxID=2647000 RepID=UPI002E80C33F|nr:MULTISPECIES: TIGR03364 family FAD-dependent oxidoreductase [unclassified Pseudarthrobacter]MEE2522458.1 TIGR03364 family FAD-dependent oxidoreductase [Pseudarthrobacter sp. J47]MEE2529211.1 TIGR03364 family FAD-dependent oxidoreductase [Pseudarthrobacter sp. J75]
MTQNPETQPSSGLPTSVDVVVVGAGIVGLAHAALAADRGLSVLVIDRDHRAVGASIRNFGHCCITAQTGDLYELATAGRKHWLDFSARAGFWSTESGAVVVARTATELRVLQELEERREPGQIVLLSAAQTLARLGRTGTNQAPTEDAPTLGASTEGAPAEDTAPDQGAGVAGGAWLRDDLRVDPRTTVAQLAAWLDQQQDAAVRWNTSALGFAAGTTRTARVQTSRGDVEADHVFVCVGHDVDLLFPEVAAEHRIDRCSLQMAAAEAPGGLELAPAVLTATSMLRYGAFVELPSAPALQAQVQAEDPELLDIGANVMFTQRPDGTLLLGDSHAYQKTADPFLAESTTDLLLDRIQGVLGVENLTVTERWQGIYASSDVGPLFVADIRQGVTAVSVTAGIGMTVSFGLAECNINALP